MRLAIVQPFHIFKMAIFSKFFGDVISHIIREHAGKRMYFFKLFIKILNLLLSPFQVSILYVHTLHISNYRKMKYIHTCYTNTLKVLFNERERGKD